MADRDSNLPLLIGVVVALAAHVAMLPLAGQVVQRGADRLALRVTDLAAPDAATAGEAIHVEYRVTNEGAARAAYAWSDRIYLSSDAALSGDDTPVATFAAPGRLEEGAHYDAKLAIVLPPRAHGRLHLLVRTDAGDSRSPFGLSTDAGVATRPIVVTLPPRPDLSVVRVEAPRQVAPDESIQVSYAVESRGEPITGAHAWRERVLLSYDDRAGADDAVLAEVERRGGQPGAAGARTVDVAGPLPERYGGDAFVIVQVDAGDAIDEYPREENNGLAVPLHVIRPREKDPDKPERTTDAAKTKPRPDPVIEPTPQEDVKLGKDDAPERLTVSWIAYDDFQELLASKSRTQQSPLQRTVDPAPVDQIPDDPTPPATRSPKASPQSVATQVVAPSPKPEVARQVEAESPVNKAQPPALVAPAEAPTVRNAPPTQLARADAAQEVARAKPIDQAAADTPRPQPGQPTTQPPSAAPSTVTPDPTKPGPGSPAADAQLALVPRDPSKADETRDAPPTNQPAAQTDEPNPDGEPTRQDESKALIKREDGAATKQLPAKTPEPDPKGQPATAKPVPAEAPPKPEARDINNPAQEKPTPTQKDQTTTKPSPAPRDAKPTAAPRDDREAPPAAFTESLVVRPGKVLTARGIEIQTVRPRFSIVTLVSAFPKNPMAKITFNGQGEVIDVELTKSTGYIDLDSPIQVSLYQWRAKGKELEKYPNGFTVNMGLILVE